VLVLSRRTLRRRRLSRGDPDERITGAWYEFTDALRLAGRPVPPHLAATEAAGFAASLAESTPTAGLGLAAAFGTSASHGPNTPPVDVPPAGLGAALPPPAATDAGGRPERRPRPAAPQRAASADTGSPEQLPPGTSPPRPLPPLGDLITGVNTVAFAPGHADAGEADRAGAQAVAYADALRARRSWWRRAWWGMHPGPLRWHSRTREDRTHGR
jgi:hypothetical protein